jgi:hypothetical protein
MKRHGVRTIRITGRLLRIGDQTYPLAHLSRVQTAWVEWKQAATTPRELWVVAAVLAGVVVLGPAVGIGRSVPGLLLAALVVAALVVGYRLLTRQRRFVLVIETSGGQSVALASRDEGELRRLEEAVTDSLENPPLTERVLQVGGDVVLGDKIGRDKYQQSGPGSSVVTNN